MAMVEVTLVQELADVGAANGDRWRRRIAGVVGDCQVAVAELPAASRAVKVNTLAPDCSATELPTS